MSTFPFKTATVIVPTLNESETIESLLVELLTRYPGIRVLVVDDVSKDGTQGLVRAFGADMDRVRDSQVSLLERIGAAERGITASVMEAVLIVDTDFVIVMDADLQHPPEVLGDIFRALAQGKELVLGARLPYRQNQGLHRILVTRLATTMAQLVLRLRGLKVSDPMSGLFACRTELLRSAVQHYAGRFEPAGYKVLFDFLRVVDPRVAYGEVHYQFGLRSNGYSKLRPIHAYYFIRSLFR